MEYKLISFNAGPSYIGEKTLNALREVIASGFLSASHRSPEFTAVSKEAIEGLRKQMQIPDDFHIFYQNSSTIAWDTVIQNVVEKNSFHFVCGEFSRRFYQTAVDLGLNAMIFDTPIGEQVEWEKAVIPSNTELITITHNETRSGIMWPFEVIKAIKTRNPNSLVAVDVCSSFGGMKMDWEAADIWLGSVQKCLSMPAGLGYLIINSKTLEKGLRLNKKMPKWRRFETLFDQMKRYQIYETPNSLAIGCLAILMRDFDLEATDKETRRKSDFLYHADLDWEPLIKDETWQSITTPHFLVDNVPQWHKKALDANFQLGSMYSDFANKGFRIANFPSHTYEIMQALVEALKK